MMKNKTKKYKGKNRGKPRKDLVLTYKKLKAATGEQYAVYLSDGLSLFPDGSIGEW